jgi:hypothetical protein
VVQILSRNTRKLRVNETSELHCVAISLVRVECVGFAEAEAWGLGFGVWSGGVGLWGSRCGV